MGIKTGETVTSTIPIYVHYRCSVCEKENLCVEHVSGSAYTATFMGINLDRNVNESAEEALKENIGSILDENNIHRFREAKFSCKCKSCGNEEPWAKMHYSDLEATNNFFMGGMIVSAFTTIGFRGCGGLFVLSLLFFILSISVCVGIKIHKEKNNKLMEQLIEKLPAESKPTILPFTPEIREAFERLSNKN